jgi:hypothetical protein
MRLISVEDFRDKYFTASSAPKAMNIRRWVRNKKIPGVNVAGCVYIEEDLWLAKIQSLLSDQDEPEDDDMDDETAAKHRELRTRQNVESFLEALGKPGE